MKWEYCVEYIAHRGNSATAVRGKELWISDIEKQLNKLGSEGWEIVHFPSDILDKYVDGYAIFKRVKEESGL